MAVKGGLIRYNHNDICLAFENTLASQAGIYFRINGPVNKVFFPVGNFLEIIHPFDHKNMTGAATANSSTIMMEVYIFLHGDIQDAFSYDDGV